MNNHNSFNHHVKSRSEVGINALFIYILAQILKKFEELSKHHQLIDDNQRKKYFAVKEQRDFCFICVVWTNN